MVLHPDFASGTAFLAAVPVTITALASLLVAIRNSSKADVASSKADKLAVRTDEIHTLANSNNERLTMQLATANDRIAHLEGMLATLVEVAKHPTVIHTSAPTVEVHIPPATPTS